MSQAAQHICAAVEDHLRAVDRLLRRCILRERLADAIAILLLRHTTHANAIVPASTWANDALDAMAGHESRSGM
jgi:hypothetical protein